MRRYDDALALANFLQAVLQSGALAYLEAPAAMLLGDVLRVRGDSAAADASLRRAIAAATRQRIRPIEIQARLSLGLLRSGTDVAAEQLTRGMEGLEQLVRDLPEDMIQVVLRSHTAERLRHAFGKERKRLLGR